MGTLILKLFNAPRRIVKSVMVKYLARVLIHFGMALNSRFSPMKLALPLLYRVMLIRSKSIHRYQVK